jgi:hypothetical protein
MVCGLGRAVLAEPCIIWNLRAPKKLLDNCWNWLKL